MSKKRSESLIAYRNELAELVVKSNEIFEKQLSYISAGAIAVSMAFVKDVTGDLQVTHCKFFLVFGWLLLVLTLLVNLISHISTKNKHNKTINEIDRNLYSRENAVKRLKQIDNLNLFTVVTLILGIISIVLFMIFNLNL